MKLTLLVISVLIFLNNFANSKFSARESKLATSVHTKSTSFEQAITASSNNDHGHSMSLGTLIISVFADLCPHGMLPLAFGFSQGTGIAPTLALFALFGSMSAYTMTSLADIAVDTNSGSISELWGNLVSQKSRWIADAMLFSLCFGCCVFYSAFIGDIFSALASAVGLAGNLAKRWIILVILSTTIVLPLCSLEDISALQFSSLLAAGGIFFTFVFHAIRLLDGTYSGSSSMVLSLSEKLRPTWPAIKYNMWNVNKGTLVMMNLLCVAFLAQYNAINYHKELHNNTPQRYRTAVVSAYGITAAVFIGMMFMGYALFGGASQPLILNNFHRSQDMLATIARSATGAAITFAYPLMFAGLKSSMFSLLFPPRPSPSLSPSPRPRSVDGIQGRAEVAAAPVGRGQKLLGQAAIVAVLSVITGIAVKCGEEDVAVVLGVVGSVLGCSVAYTLPAVLKVANMKRRKALGLKISGWAALANYLIALLGVVFAVVGAWITLQAQPHHH